MTNKKPNIKEMQAECDAFNARFPVDGKVWIIGVSGLRLVDHVTPLAALTTTITTAPVTRDKYGFWLHPGLPDIDEGETDKWYDWVRSMNIEIDIVSMEDDDEAKYEKYVEDGCGDISAWNPTVPDGDGWFLLGIFDTEDGPCAEFARPLTGTAA